MISILEVLHEGSENGRPCEARNPNDLLRSPDPDAQMFHAANGISLSQGVAVARTESLKTSSEADAISGAVITTWGRRS